MTTEEVAKGLVALCREGKPREAIETYYGQDIVSIEAQAAPDGSRETKGLTENLAKLDWWLDNHEVHSTKASEPMFNGDQFAVIFNYDLTFKPANKHFVLDEVGIYTVQDGKIVEERFFYSPMG